MIISNKNKNVVIEGVESKGKMFINSENTDYLVRILTETYADPIGSLIREAVANAKDSHTMANNNDPIVVMIKEEVNNSFSFIVKDEGLGLDEVSFAKYIMGIGESSKRNLANVIGGFGLGAKAASSYQKNGSYFYTCIKDGIKRKFMIFRGESLPEYSKLSEENTDEKNGVSISVPILKNDLKIFLDKIKEQLKYFSNVYFVNCDIDNSYKIYREKHYQYSELNKDNDLHITLDDIYYPIDFSKLEIDRIKLPIALRFTLIDGLIPIPNRENLEYNRVTKKIIKDKIELVIKQLKDKYIEQTNIEISNKQLLISILSDDYEFISVNDKKIYLRDPIFGKIPNPKFKVKDINHLNVLNLSKKLNVILHNYPIVHLINNYKFTSQIKYINYPLDNPNNNIYILDSKEKIPKNIIKYLKSFNKTYFIRKKNQFLFKGENSLYNLLELNNYPKNQWREVIKDFYKIQEILISDFKKIKDIVLPQSFLDSLVIKKTKNIVLENEILFKNVEHRSTYRSTKKISIEILKLDLIDKNRIIYFYTTELKLAKVFYETFEFKCLKFKIGVVNDKNSKKLEDLNLKNTINIDSKKYNKLLSKYITTYYIKTNLNNNFNYVFRKVNFINDFISKDLADKIIKFKSEVIPVNINGEFREFMTTLTNVFNVKNYLDPSLMEDFKQLNDFLEKIDDISFLFNILDLNSNAEHQKIMLELLKNRNIKRINKVEIIENKIFAI